MPEDFRPAWYCPGATRFLIWSTKALRWELHADSRLVGTLPGYPVSAPPNTADRAVAWATEIAGPQQWIQRPPHAGHFHTHHDAATCNANPKEN